MKKLKKINIYYLKFFKKILKKKNPNLNSFKAPNLIQQIYFSSLTSTGGSHLKKKQKHIQKVRTKVAVKKSVNAKKISKKFSNLTKKQKQKIKIKKAQKLVYKDSSIFLKFGSIPRNLNILLPLSGKSKFVYDGYSWSLIKITDDYKNFKAGSIAFKTRALSPVKIKDKGKMHLNMAQKTSFKIKSIKVKRKK